MRDDNFDKSLGAWLKSKRIEKGYTMQFLADRLGVTRTAIDDDTNEKISALCHRNGEWLFGDDTPLNNNIISSHFKKNLESAGLPHMRIHDLRHSHVSMLWDAGVPVPAISKRIGHSSPKVTMECYSHIFDKEEEKTLKFLNNLKK